MIRVFCRGLSRLLMPWQHWLLWIIICGTNLKMNDVTNKTIGIIGYGNFGKVICEYLFPKNKLFVYSPHINKKGLPSNLFVSRSIQSLVEVSDIIIPAVPIRKFENV